MKKIFSFICVCMLFAQTVFAADVDPYKGTKGLEYEYHPEWKVAWVNGRGTAKESHIVVPQLVRVGGEDFRVNQINQDAFYQDTKLKSIVLPEGLNNIGWGAFDSCMNLTTVVLPQSIETINNFAFYHCKNLTSIDIPANLSYTGLGAFAETGITTPLFNDICFMYMPPSFRGSYEIKAGTEKIGGGAFAFCENLYAIKIPQSVKWIGEGAFWNCTRLSELIIPNDSIDWLPPAICKNCSSLRFVKLPSAITEISKEMFNGCINLQSIVIPESVQYIDDDAFSNCEQLTDITLPKGLKNIGDFAFSKCKNLNQITLPNSVEEVGEGAFNECSKFTKPVFNTTVFAYLPASYKGEYAVRDGIKKIAGWAFVEAEGITYIKLPNSVVELGTAACCNDYLTVPVFNKNVYAFMPEDYKGAYVIPDGIKVIGAGAFRFCEQMTSITIPNSVTEIGSKAFEQCYSLRNVVIPSSVTSLAEDAFPSGCRLIRQ